MDALPVVFIALVIGVTFLIGYALPARTTISRSIKPSPEAVFAADAADGGVEPQYRKVEMLPPVEARKQPSNPSKAEW